MLVSRVVKTALHSLRVDVSAGGELRLNVATIWTFAAESCSRGR